MDALPSWLPAPGRRRYTHELAVIDKHIYAIIAAARGKQRVAGDLLAMLMEAVDADSGEGMTASQLRDEIASLFLAGYETTSIGLSWAYEFLARHPELQHKLQAEVDGVLRGRRPCFADIVQLGYARMVFQEALRLRPPAWQLPRVAVQDDRIDGYLIRAGTTVISFIYAISPAGQSTHDARRSRMRASSARPLSMSCRRATPACSITRLRARSEARCSRSRS